MYGDCVASDAFVIRTYRSCELEMCLLAGEYEADCTCERDKSRFKKDEAEIKRILGDYECWCSPLSFLTQLCGYQNADSLRSSSPVCKPTEVALLLLEIALFDSDQVQQIPSVAAAAAYCLAESVFDRASWVRSLDA